MSALFGPAGNCQDFYDAGFKATVQIPAWLQAKGLTAYEYQCGRGVKLSDKTAEELRAAAEAHGIMLSIHAPYFISLASADPEKRDNSLRYILESGRAVKRLGGTRIVVHPGGLGGLSRAEATELAAHTLARAQQALDDEGLTEVRICPETMGKINQLGDLEEVLRLCAVDERFLPCIDFGHLNSRTHGGMNSREDFIAAIDRITDALGAERGRQFHAHFSKIQYTDGGEKMHLTFEDTVFGPDPAPLMELIAERDLSPTIICESAGTQTRDAETMLHLWQKAVETHTKEAGT